MINLKKLIPIVIVLSIVCFFGCGNKSTNTNSDNQKSQSEKKSKKPNILFITIDTLRMDRVAAYGNSNIKTPNMDELAKDGVLFENAYSVQPVTLPSHSSMLTGQYPFTHGVRDNNIYKLKDDTVTLAEQLKKHGYLTTAFVASYILNHKFGLDQGFDFYNDKFITPQQKGRLPVERRASEVSLLATEWQEAMKDKTAENPFFLWLHYYDPHANYDPPEPYKSAYQNPYDGEIAYTDDWLGFLFNDLKKRNLWDDTIVVLMADHGDSLGEHGENTHGMFIYSATTHVPLLIKYNKKLPKGKRVIDRVSGVDIVPTILELADIPPITKVDGLSLVDLMVNDKHLDSRPVYSEVYIPRSFGWSELKGVRQDDLFFIDGPLEELYKNERMLAKLENIKDKQPEDSKKLHTIIDNMIASGIPLEQSDSIEIDEDMATQLAALGYFVNSNEDSSKKDDSKQRPDPKTRINIFNMYQKATGLMGRNGYSLALPVLRQIIKDDPGNPRFIFDLVNTLTNLDELKEAEVLLLKLIKEYPTDKRYTSQLAKNYLKENKLKEAEAAFEATLVLDPKNIQAQFNLGMLQITKNNWSKARTIFEQIVKDNPKNVKAINNLGYILIKGENRVEEGIALISKALELSPDNPTLLISLASAYKNSGDIKSAKPLFQKAKKLAPNNPHFKNKKSLF